MAQLYFKYGAMGSSKTANALMTRFNYEERGQKTLLVKPRLDTRDGDHMVVSRIGLTYPCIYFDEMQQLSVMELQQNACVIVDEAQFLTREEVMYLVGLVDDLGIPVICYGLRADFKGDLFPGSEALLVMADKIEEVKTICWCGKKATFNARFDAAGKVLKEGEQVVLGATSGCAASTGWPGTWARTSAPRTCCDLPPVPQKLRRGADGDEAGRRVRDAQRARGGPGHAPPLGGAVPGGGARRRVRVLLRLQSPVLLLPEQAHLPGGGGEGPDGGAAAGDLSRADRTGGRLPGPGDPHPLHRRGSGGPGGRGMARAGGVELRRL